MALIYIVEDDDSIREIEEFALMNAGHKVIGFSCARDFFNKLDQVIPELCILDIMLPDENGNEIVRKLRRNPDTKKLEGQGSVLVKNDGTAQFTFEHASDYVISVTDEAAITNTKKSPNGGDDQNMALYIALMGFAAAMIGVSAYRKKRS